MIRLVDCPTSCGNTVDFCCEIIIPSHYDVLCLPEVTFDPDCITCVEGICEQTATVTNPCNENEQIQCVKEFKSISAVGAIRYVAAVQVQNECMVRTYFCCQDTVCVNQVLCVKCPENDGCFNNDSEIRVMNIVKEERPSEICPDEKIVKITGTFVLPECTV
jgi:hypothetical protein